MTERQVFPALTLSVQELVCARGGMPLTAPLNFTVQPGQCLLLRGPNGTGKTTLLLTLAGMVAPFAGQWAVGGGGDEQVLHYAGHRNALKGRLTVGENLRFWRAINGATGVEVNEALAAVGLRALADLDAAYLSAGQARRLALARLLVTYRPVWLLDEPTAALDADGHELVTRLIDGHLSQGGLAVAATHDPIALQDPSRMKTLVLGAQP